MKKLLLLAALFSITLGASSQIVTGIKAEYHHGQTFVTWKVIPNYTYRFYYVYRYDSPITDANKNSATYMGKVLENFSLNYFLNLGIFGGPIVKDSFYMVINNDPWTQLDSTDGFIAVTCTKEKTYYYAVTADSTVGAGPLENKRMVPASNATTTGIAEHVAPIEAYLQVTGIPLEDNANLLYDGYCMFGTNQKTEYTPLMANEACFANNFGLIKDLDFSTPKNACTFFFYGGGGNAFDNANGTNVDAMWKVSMEDDLPNFNWDALGGENTKWIGYNENFDVYNANQFSAFPTTGIDRTYTIARVKWTLDWVKREFPNDIDTTQIAMQGSSNGCTGALTMAYLYPDLISAVDVTNAKFNVEYLGDPNKKCKWNANGTSRNRANIYLGEQATNLQSDIPKIKDVGYYGLYDFANFNNLIQDNKYNSLPVIFVTSGKSDDVTCW
ncbi:MAG: hypothetical protein LH473_11695, partial [Chitinophagales bacterium]|nr:hypothetical protein [Chitinophagales bacterium]